MELSQQAFSEQEDNVGSLTQQLEAVQLQKHILPQGKAAGDQGDGSTRTLENRANDYDYELDVKSTEVLEARMKEAGEELLKLRGELSQAGKRYSALEQSCRQEKERWRGEAHELAEKIRQCIKSSRQDQERISELEKEIGATRKVATDSEGHLSMAQEELLAFSEELANLYHHICVCNNLTPKRVTLDYYRDGARGQSGGSGGKSNHLHPHPHHGRNKRRSNELFAKAVHGGDGNSRPGTPQDSCDNSPTPRCSSPAPVCPSSPTMDFRDPSNVRNLVAVIRCQIKHLQVRVPPPYCLPLNMHI